MTVFNRKAGQYVLNHFRIYKLDEPEAFIDISALIHQWSLVESMDNGFLHGSARIYDSVSLMDTFLGENNGWLKGEEEIEVSYTDFFENNNIEKYFVYAITNLKSAKRGNETIYQYDIHFVSKEKFYSDRHYVRKAYRNGRISEFVDDAFREFFNSDKQIDIQDTEGTTTIIVPNYSPEQTMQLFARKAYSGDDSQNTFRFYETRKGFFFKTLEQVVDDNTDFDETDGPFDSTRPIFGKFEEPDQTPQGQITLMSTLIDIEYPKHINTIQDMREGAYNSSVRELDFLNRTTVKIPYKYLEEYNTYVFPDGNAKTRSKHSKEFVDRHMFDSRDNLVIKDYTENAVSPAIRRDTHYPEIYNNKNVSLYHHENEIINIKVYGRNSLSAGDMVFLKLDDVHFALESRKPDLKRSGKYIVEKVESFFSEENYVQLLTVSKSGYQGRQEGVAPQATPDVTESTSDGEGDVREPSQAGRGRDLTEAEQQTYDDLLVLAKDAGFEGEDAEIAAAVAMAESTGDPNALNDNRSTGDLSYGLWQINMIDDLGPERVDQFGISTYDELYVPETNAAAAFDVYTRAGNSFTPWSVYKSGAYKEFLP